MTDPDYSFTSGWNPYQPFYPKDDFSRKMLSSIVTKLSKWLENMGVETCGEFHELEWNYDPDGGTILFGADSNDYFIQIWWDRHSKEANDYTICGSDKRFEDITNNLEFFTGVEKAIYSELEGLQKDLHETLSADELVVREPTPLTQEQQFERDRLQAEAAVGAGASGFGGVQPDKPWPRA